MDDEEINNKFELLAERICILREQMNEVLEIVSTLVNDQTNHKCACNTDKKR